MVFGGGDFVSWFLYIMYDKAPTLFICMWIFSFLAPFVEMTILYPWNSLSLHVGHQLTVYTRVCFWDLSSVPLVCMSVFMLISHGFDYYSFVISFEIKKMWLLQIFLFQDFSGYSWILEFHVDFRMRFSISEKKKIHLGSW